MTYLRPSLRYPALSKYHSDSGFIQRMSHGRLMMYGARVGCDMVAVGQRAGCVVSMSSTYSSRPRASMPSLRFASSFTSALARSAQSTGKCLGAHRSPPLSGGALLMLRGEVSFVQVAFALTTNSPSTTLTYLHPALHPPRPVLTYSFLPFGTCPAADGDSGLIPPECSHSLRGRNPHKDQSHHTPKR